MTEYQKVALQVAVERFGEHVQFEEGTEAFMEDEGGVMVQCWAPVTNSMVIAKLKEVK